jgi:CDP-glycerol glycerophosphotransferase (TagB/SpsB family)
LHPSHFQERPSLFREEREKIQELEKEYPHVHVVRPVPLGGSLGYYSGEDMDEKASMMAHSDVMVTVYSTMLVETAVHDTPMIAAVIDTVGGWQHPRKYSLSLRKIGNWPTHRRFRMARAGRVASNPEELCHAIDLYLKQPDLDAVERRQFVEQEITYTDGSAGKRTAEFILGRLRAEQS